MGRLNYRLACREPRFDDLTEICGPGIEGRFAKLPHFIFKSRRHLLEVLRLFLDVALDVTEIGPLLFHKIDAIPDQPEGHAGLQKNKA